MTIGNALTDKIRSAAIQVAKRRIEQGHVIYNWSSLNLRTRFDHREPTYYTVSVRAVVSFSASLSDRPVRRLGNHYGLLKLSCTLGPLVG